MDRLRRVLAFIAVGALAVGFLVLLERTDAARWAVSLLLSLAFGGPAAILLLQPLLVVDGRGWVRVVGKALPALALGLLCAEGSIAFGQGGAGMTGTRLAFLMGHAVGLAVAVGVRREDVRWDAVALAALLGLLPWTRNLVGIAFFLVEVAAFVAATGLQRPASSWLRASLAAVAIFTAGLVILALAQGSLIPPRVVLDDGGFERLVLPLGGLAMVGFLVVLLHPRFARAPS